MQCGLVLAHVQYRLRFRDHCYNGRALQVLFTHVRLYSVAQGKGAIHQNDWCGRKRNNDDYCGVNINNYCDVL